MMTQLAFWALVGWCGTVPRRFPLPPPPDPWPWWRNPLIGVLGGIGGGFLVQSGFGYQEIVAGAFGALAGGRILSEFSMGMTTPMK